MKTISSKCFQYLGSTPLDLFKLYVDDLKARFHEEKKVIKEILKDKHFEVSLTMKFEDFSDLIKSEAQRSLDLDPGNIKLMFNNMLEKAEAKEKERQREEQKKQKKVEQNFKNLLKKYDVNENTKYDEIKEKIHNEEIFLSITDDKERERIFGDYIVQLQETCLHHVKKKKEKRKKNKRSRSPSSPAGSDQSDEEDHKLITRMSKKDRETHKSGKESRHHETNESKHKEDKSSNDKGEDKMDDESRNDSKSSKKHKKSKRKKKVKSVT